MNDSFKAMYLVTAKDKTRIVCKDMETVMKLPKEEVSTEICVILIKVFSNLRLEDGKCYIDNITDIACGLLDVFPRNLNESLFK